MFYLLFIYQVSSATVKTLESIIGELSVTLKYVVKVSHEVQPASSHCPLSVERQAVFKNIEFKRYLSKLQNLDLFTAVF